MVTLSRQFDQELARLVGLAGQLTTPQAGAGAAQFASRPAPANYRWDFVSHLGQGVTHQGEPVVALVRIN